VTRRPRRPRNAGKRRSEGYDPGVTPSVRLRLRVVPGAKRDAFVGPYGFGWKVRVAAAPERGAANRAVVALVARTLRVPERDVTLVSGQTTRDKIVELTGIDASELDGRLASAEEEDSAR
jgi:uncharacterized protein YggU (UPF0235/DUF167 family)